MHTLKEVSPGIVIGITSAIEPTSRTIRALADMLRGRNPGLSVSHRDSASGFWFSAVQLTNEGVVSDGL
jgi:hypothetical protein